ncbi:RNA-binding protein 47 isoform X1 [Dermatophagoides farinae]|uniref:RNA-binding protein 47 isoform X1 n=1 Tax=Dermatophagoides farinae TaxID=6954 RepID=UPI003F5F7460
MTQNSIDQSKDLLISLAKNLNYRVAQENGQRIFGPPLDWNEESIISEKGTEVFVGKIPRDCFENELIPLFEKPGRIYKMRLMIDFSGKNRGYGFVQYFNKKDAQRAIEMLNHFEIRKRWPIGVMLSRNNNRLFFGNLPNDITKQEMIDEVAKHTSGIINAIYYGGSTRTNGFGFVEYENHKMTALARRKFFPGSILLFDRQPKVDWAKSEEEIDDDFVSNNSVLYVRFIKPDITEENLKKFFSFINNGQTLLNINRVKKIRNFAFIHYENPKDAQMAYSYFHRIEINLGQTMINEIDQELEIKWAKNKSIHSSSVSPTNCMRSPRSKEFSSQPPRYYRDSNRKSFDEFHNYLCDGGDRPMKHFFSCNGDSTTAIDNNINIGAMNFNQSNFMHPYTFVLNPLIFNAPEIIFT